MEGLSSTHLSLGRRLKGLSFSCSDFCPACRGSYPRLRSPFLPADIFSVLHPPLSQGVFSDKQRSSLARLQSLFHLRLIQPFPFYTSNLTTSPE